MRRNPVLANSSLHSTNNSLGRPNINSQQIVETKNSVGYHSLQQSLAVPSHGNVAEMAMQQVNAGKIASSIEGLQINQKNVNVPPRGPGHETIRGARDSTKGDGQGMSLVGQSQQPNIKNLHLSDITFDSKNNNGKAKASYGTRGSQLYAKKDKLGGDSKSQGIPVSNNPCLVNNNQLKNGGLTSLRQNGMSNKLVAPSIEGSSISTGNG